LFSLGKCGCHFGGLGHINLDGNGSFGFVFTTTARGECYFESILSEFARYSLLDNQSISPEDQYIYVLFQLDFQLQVLMLLT
jgi:hypothetical protein